MTPPPNCQCLICCEHRGELCRTCLAWIGGLGMDARVAAHMLAKLRATTISQAQADMLADYHRQHEEQP